MRGLVVLFQILNKECKINIENSVLKLKFKTKVRKYPQNNRYVNLQFSLGGTLNDDYPSSFTIILEVQAIAYVHVHVYSLSCMVVCVL